MYQDMLRCWAEVDLDAIADNFELIKQKAEGAQIMAVVKADAYGHGDSVIAPYFETLGADWFAVSCLAEAKRLRRIGIRKPVLILGYTAPAAAAELAALHAVQVITDLQYAGQLNAAALAAGCRVRCHMALDTGMGRIGFCVRSDFITALAQMRACCAMEHLDVCGAFTHFAVADSLTAEDIAYTDRQHQIFANAVGALQAEGIVLETVHCCNSAALFGGKIPHYDLVRPGIVQYGLNPSPEMAVFCTGLRPTICVKACVAMVKELKKGECISYGRIFCADRYMKIATVTAGYADGYPRTVSGKGICSIHGRSVPQIGRVCMDQMMVDVSALENVQPGDEVILFGGGAADSIDALAAKTDTVNYTVICELSRRVPRIYLKGGVEVGRLNYLEQ